MKRLLHFACVAFLAACGNGSSSTDMGPSVCPNPLPNEAACLAPASSAATRTACGDVTEFCSPGSAGSPNLACLATPPTPQTDKDRVTLTGFVHVFSNGPNSNNVSVAVYDAQPLLAGQDIGTQTPIANDGNVMLVSTTQRACDVDVKLGCAVPSSAGCTTPACDDGLNGHLDGQKYCRNDGGSGTCNDRLRWESRYTLDAIPTNKQLAIRTSGMNGQANQSWASLVSWNVYIPAVARVCVGDNDNECYTDATHTKFQLNVNALSRTDYVNIPTTAGLSGGISDGKGAVAGEVHDCDNVRIENAVVTVVTADSANPVPVYDRFTYFNGQPLKTLPDPSRVATDRLGLFAALNIKPGKVHIASAGTVDGTFKSLGDFDLYVYPNTVSIVNLNAGRPHP